MESETAGYIFSGRRWPASFIFYFLTSLTHVSTYRARDSLFDAVHPLLQAIGRYAGCYVSLIAGNAPKDTDDGFFTA